MSVVKCVASLDEDKYENITDNRCYFAEICVKYWGFFVLILSFAASVNYSTVLTF